MRKIMILSAVAITLSAAAFAQTMQGMPPGSTEMKAARPPEITKAIAVLMPAENNPVRGVVRFEKTEGGIKVTADVTGLTPGKHGFHIHEFGDCSAPDFTSAGGHFMVSGETHGAPTSATSHLGDMGNLEAGADGHAYVEWIDSHISFDGPNSIIGRSMVVHEKEDDLTTQPTGNAGGRIACGVIGIAKQ